MTDDTPSPARANFTLAVLLLAYMLSLVDRQILSLMVDPIRHDLGLSDLQIGLLQGFAFVLLYSILGVPLGLLADRFNRKWIITGGVIFWSAATILCSRATSFATLFAARMSVGIGEAALSPAAHSLLGDSFPPNRLTRAMAIYALGITLGAGLAFIVGGAVIQAVASTPTVTLPIVGAVRSWQAAFIIVGLPGIVVAVLTALMREPPRRYVRATTPGLSALRAHLTANARAYLGIYLSSGLFAIAGISMISWYPTLLIRSYGLTPGQAGLAFGLIYMILGSGGTIAGALLAERLTKSGRSDANLRVVWLCAIGFVIPSAAGPLMPDVRLTLVLLGVTCFVYSGYFGCATAAIQASTPGPLRATNAAVFLLVNALFATTLGAVIAPAIDAMLFDGTGNLGPAMALVALICPIAAALAAWQGLGGYGRLVAQLQANR